MTDDEKQVIISKYDADSLEFASYINDYYKLRLDTEKLDILTMQLWNFSVSSSLDRLKANNKK